MIRTRGLVVLALILPLAGGRLASAQDLPASPAPKVGPVIGGSHATNSQICVDVQIGSDRSYGCVNQLLQDAVPRARGMLPSTVVTANGGPTATGTFSQTATHERLGTAFGHSASPQRPPRPVFVNPLVANPGR